ncbi:putative zinc-type alcohol dehydrogenase-like protein [Lachnellula willkommii]|uniref:Putative zinc-type alcohol dehydrogenase-like protein n=1 Tax=Lachnellula willkommii TaxID=215461 RepID=A0A559MKC6_9HELO|nr:putative zinc-type alcohol dehydrogenase-like protein [Lachnellula willkommii]
MPQSLTIRKIKGKPGQVYYPLQLNDVPKPVPGPGELLVKIHAAALNHRDFFIRQHLYPGISFTNPLLCDGCGTVVETGPDCSQMASSLLNKLVILTPCLGWESDIDGPEDVTKYAMIGSSDRTPLGAAQDYILVREEEVALCPSHLSPVEGAALPLVGLTGWRAFVTKSGNAKAGRNILVTGIGGGVALQVLQIGVAMGANIYVTSGNEGKIEKAVRLGAKGGVNYKSEGWEKKLQKMLPSGRPYLDAVIDGAGGDIVPKASRILKQGGVICCYGMTVAPKLDFPMVAVFKQIDLRGSSAGSRSELKAFLDFVGENKIRPVISRTVKGLDNIDAINGLFEDMKFGTQFGKLIIEVDPTLAEAKL